MLAHGTSIELIVELVRTGLATATGERVVAGKLKIEVPRERPATMSRKLDQVLPRRGGR
jgi:hypothetical protein